MDSQRIFKRVLITGIRGSGASYMAEYLVDNYPDVELFGIARWHSTDSSNRNLRNVQNKVKVYTGDLMDVMQTTEILREVQPDAIIHLAAHSNVKTSFMHPLSVIEGNVMGTANLFEAVRFNNMRPTILMCSTSEVYGVVRKEDTPIGERHPIQPVNPYAVSKLAQDALAYAYYKSYGFPVVRTRAFTYLNPRRHDIFATTFTRQVVEIELGLRTVLKHGNLNSTRTIIDVRDCMRAYWYAITLGKIGDVYNIGGNTVVTVEEFLDLLISKAKCPIPHEVDSALLRPVDVTMQIPDVTKFAADTGWAPKYSFKESMEFFLKEVRHDVCHENGLKYNDYY